MRRSLTALALAMVLPLPALAAEVVVRPGETLSEIAERQGVSLSALMQRNGISNPDLVVAGSRLVIPGTGGGGAAGGGRSAAGGSGRHTVQPGETLSEIADRYGLSTRRLMQINGINDPNLVVAGTQLRLSGGSGPSRGGSSSLPASASGRHTVRSGETLSDIADRYNTSTSRLIALNDINDPNLVVSGTRLVVPVPPKPAARPSYNVKAREHVVRTGETLSDIASGYRLSMEKLIALNGLKDPDHLYSGTKLKLRESPAPARAATKASAKPAATAAAKPKPKPTLAAKPQPRPAVVSQPDPQPAVASTPQPQPQPVVANAAPATRPVAAASPEAKAAEAPAPQPKPAVASAPQAKPVVTSATQPTGTNPAIATAQPQPKPASQPLASTSRPTSTTATTTAATTPTAAVVRSTTVARASKSSTTAATSGRGSSPDWRNYGPLQVDWANWQAMAGSYVTPSLNRDGQPLYLAINCNARKLNATGQSGQWKTWDAPKTDSEQQLVRDLCRLKGS